MNISLGYAPPAVDYKFIFPHFFGGFLIKKIKLIYFMYTSIIYILKI